MGKITGRKLYEHVIAEVKRHGYDFPIEKGSYGHPIGIFLHEKFRLAEFDDIVEDNTWILEILIYDPKL